MWWGDEVRNNEHPYIHPSSSHHPHPVPSSCSPSLLMVVLVVDALPPPVMFRFRAEKDQSTTVSTAKHLHLSVISSALLRCRMTVMTSQMRFLMTNWSGLRSFWEAKSWEMEEENESDFSSKFSISTMIFPLLWWWWSDDADADGWGEGWWWDGWRWDDDDFSNL